MSWDWLVWTFVDNLSPEALLDIYKSLPDPDPSLAPRNSAGIQEFIRELDEQWPQLDDVPEEKRDDCPWMCSHVVTETYVWLSMTTGHKYYKEASTAMLECARRNSLLVFDPQMGLAHVPDGRILKAPHAEGGRKYPTVIAPGKPDDLLAAKLNAALEGSIASSHSAQRLLDLYAQTQRPAEASSMRMVFGVWSTKSAP